jgi:hypothetical protein
MKLLMLECTLICIIGMKTFFNTFAPFQNYKSFSFDYAI